MLGVGGMLLKNRHTGDMRKRLSDKQIRVVELTGAGAEQAEGTEHDARGAHRDGVHGGEASVQRGGNEARPPFSCVLQVGDGDGLAAGVAVDARTFVCLELEKFKIASLLGGGGQEPELAQRVGEQKSGGGDVEEVGALLGEVGQQVDDVEVVEQRVDERDDGVEHAGFARDVGHVALHGYSSRSRVRRRSRMSRATSVALRPVA